MTGKLEFEFQFGEASHPGVLDGAGGRNASTLTHSPIALLKSRDVARFENRASDAMYFRHLQKRIRIRICSIAWAPELPTADCLPRQNGLQRPF